MLARVSTIQGSPPKLKGAVHQFREQFLPVARRLTGFLGAYVLVDRHSGKFVSVTLWENESALRASDALANRLRAQAAEAVGTIEPPVVEVYEVVVQPEL